MAWKEWAARIGGYALAPYTGGASIAIGEGIAQGLHNNEAIKEADATTQAATQQGVQAQQGALQRAGDVYTQQRQDTQNLANAPYQTLGSLMGINIPSLGAPAGNVPTSNDPTGWGVGLHPRQPGEPLTVQPGNYDFAPGFTGQTLAGLVNWQNAAKAKTGSAYKRA